jgi:hypothetical protein
MDSENRKMIVDLIDAVIIKTKIPQAIKPAGELPWKERRQRTLARLRKRAQGYSEKEIMQIVDEAVEAVRLEERKAT